MTLVEVHLADEGPASPSSRREASRTASRLQARCEASVSANRLLGSHGSAAHRAPSQWSGTAGTIASVRAQSRRGPGGPLRGVAHRPPHPTVGISSARHALIEFGFLLSSLGLLQGARFGFSILVATSVSLEAFTQWGLMLALMTYAPTLLLGSGNGMNRLVPLLRGRGDLAGADAAERAAWLIAVIVVTLLGILAGVLATLGYRFGSVVTLLMALACLYQLQQFSLRSHMSFGTASLQQGAFGLAIAAAGLVVLLVGETALLAVTGAYAGAHVVAVLIGVALAPPRFGPLTGAAVRYAVTEGAPIMLAGLLFGLLVTMDRWVIALSLKPADSGPYTFASIVSAVILLLPMVVGQQTYPRMARQFGRNRDVAAVLALASTQNRYAVAATLIPTVLVAVIGPAAIPLFLPEYSNAVLPLIILGLAWLIYSGATGWANFLIVVGRQRRYLAIQTAVLVAALPLLFAGAALAGLIGTALGVLGVMSVYAVVLGLAAHRLTQAADT